MDVQPFFEGKWSGCHRAEYAQFMGLKAPVHLAVHQLSCQRQVVQPSWLTRSPCSVHPHTPFSPVPKNLGAQLWVYTALHINKTGVQKDSIYLPINMCNVIIAPRVTNMNYGSAILDTVLI